MTRFTDVELEALLKGTESDLAECAESISGDVPSRAREVVCAFANDLSKYNLPFDLYPVPTATLGDLSKTIFLNEYLPAAFAPDILEENNRTYEERLASCKMIVSLDDPTPTVLGLLAIGKSPQDLL